MMNRPKTRRIPGTAHYTGRYVTAPVQIHYLQYNGEQMHEEHRSNHDMAFVYQNLEGCVQWYDIRGLHDTKIVEAIGNAFSLHPLVLDDITNADQRPKLEEYENGILMILHAIDWDAKEKCTVKQNVGIFLGDGFVLSFQENENDLLHEVRNRIHKGAGRIRNRGADYLMYALIDDIGDIYFNILQEINQEISNYEEAVVDQPTEEVKLELHQLKKSLTRMRKAVYPLREGLGMLERSTNTLIKPRTKPFLRNLYDHTIQVTDSVDTARDLISGVQDLYNSEINFRMNKVMQLLTIITTIFVPLSFVAAVYGMNFDNMPELRWRYGYFFLLGFMLFVFGGAIWYFKRRKWL